MPMTTAAARQEVRGNRSRPRQTRTSRPATRMVLAGISLSILLLAFKPFCVWGERGRPVPGGGVGAVAPGVHGDPDTCLEARAP